MLLDICFGSKSVWRVLMLYGESPGAGFTRQDLREHTKLGNKALSFALKRLTSFGILKKNKEGQALALYKLDNNNNYIECLLDLLKKERQNLNYLPYTFSSIAREFSREVLDSFDVISMYLFGSIAKGTFRDDSDIDFAVIVDEKNPKYDLVIDEIADTLSTRFKRKIQCFILTKKQMNDKKNNLAREILKHGVKLV